MSFLMLQFRVAPQPIIKEGSIANMATPSLLWSGSNIEGISGNSGIAVSLVSSLNASRALTSSMKRPVGNQPAERACNHHRSGQR